MAVLWERPHPSTAREISEQLPGRQPAYTTLLTVLERLCQKGHVARVGDAPRGVRFRPVKTEAEHASSAMLATLGETSNRGAALLNFAGNLTADDVNLLKRALDLRAPGGRGEANRE
jgi:predicted transcriptional regulator